MSAKGWLVSVVFLSNINRHKDDDRGAVPMKSILSRTRSIWCASNRKTATFFSLRLREIIALELEAESEAMFGGEIEVGGSYFGGKRGR